MDFLLGLGERGGALPPLILLPVGLAIILVLALVDIAYMASRRLLKPPRRRGEWTPRDLGYDYEDIMITTSDGVVLRGWFGDRGSDKTVIVVHGYTSSRWDNTYIKPVVDMLARNGFNVVVIDLRAHGESGGEYTTLGYLEVRDLIELIDWLKRSRPEKTRRIGVIGYSMGGAIAIMLASRSEAPVNAVVADSPYISVVSSGERWIMRMKGVMRSVLLLVYPLIVWFASRSIGVRVEELDMRRYAEKIKKPILVIAGRNDDLVGVEEIREFFDSLKKTNENAELWVTDAPHVRSVELYPREYEDKVVGFFRRWLQ
jgi:dipeptidyl aminopeptidase/acylaminoacyl peptidase